MAHPKQEAYREELEFMWMMSAPATTRRRRIWPRVRYYVYGTAMMVIALFS